MYSIRKWMFKPKKSDKSLLARLYYADEALNSVAAELDSFDGRKEPERCTLLINKLRNCQDKVLGYVEKIMDEAITDRRASRDFRVKFPDDVLQDNLAGQLWFGAECLSAGSSIMNREVESASMRPLARSLTRHLDQLRTQLREHSMKNQATYPDELKRSLEVFDKLFSEFELSYVSAMVPVKTMRDYDILQEVMVLFSETIQRALQKKLVTQDMLDDYDPALMFTIPRLAIVCGLITYPEGPLNPDMDPVNMCEMFRPFQTLLYKIRELLATLTEEELHLLEKCLCSSDVPAHLTEGLNLEKEDKKQSSSSSQKEPLNTIPKAASAGASSALPSTQGSSTVTKRKRQSVEDIEENMYLSSESSSYRGHQGHSVAEDVGSSSSDSEMNYDSESSPHEGRSSDSVSSHSTDDEAPATRGASVEGRDRVKLTSSPGMKKSMPHQESKDSGMPSEPDPLNFETHTVESHRLRHSRSWPDTLASNNSKKTAHSKSPSMNECLRKGGDLGATGGGPSLELIDSSHSDLEGDGELLNRSAQEFTFNIPRNTSLDHPSAEEDVAEEASLVPSINFQGLESSNGGTGASSSNATPRHLAGHVAYVTDALNSTFMTDPGEAFEVTLVAANRDTSEEEPKESLVCTRCQSRQVLHNEDQLCDRPCDSKSVSTKSCDHTQPSRYDDSHTQEDCCVHPAVHSQRPDVCLTCQQRLASGVNKTIEDADDVSGTTVSRLERRDRRDDNKTSSPVESKSKGEQIHHPGTSAASGTDTERPNKECPCSSHTGRQKRSSLDVPRASKVHYRRMKSTEISKHADKDSVSSGDSVSQTSDSPEESEITLAIQAAEVAARKEARARFKSSGELIHRLFVCISGVADQLQTNYAADLRHILKCVFECNSSEVTPAVEEKSSLDSYVNISAPGSPNENFTAQPEPDSVVENEGSSENREVVCSGAPVWVPDEEVANCTACKAVFTFVRRRHHCRNCGNIFCGRCSSNNVPLPQYGHDKPVRVCNRCFVFHVTPFTTVDE